MSNISKSDAQRRRQANAAMYAPRQTLGPMSRPAHSKTEDPRLRRLLVDTLDALKRPDAVPSTVIRSALNQAASMN